LSAPPSDDFVGRILGGRYRLIASLGGGSSAAVFAAEDMVLRRRVAVKVLHPALAADQAFLRRFQTEAQLAAALRHPNVLLVHDWGNDGGTPYLVTELLEGGSLKDLIGRGVRATPSQALGLGLQACRGLDHAHRRGLVHSDIKPANLLFDDAARLRVADFGLARAIAEAAATEPLGVVLGTARYASPEQAQGRNLDGRSDVYSLALVLVELITGQVPFAADTSAATLLARLDRPLEPPVEVGPLTAALAAAGRTERDERVDAAGFARLLKAAARQLDPPRPLPIVALHVEDVRRDVGPLVDPTAPLPPYDVDGDGKAPEISAATAAGREVPPRAEALDPSVARPAALPAPPAAGVDHRRRRTGLVVLLVVLLALAGLAAAAAVVQPWRPVVDVPVVVGLSREEAAARLEAADLRLSEGDRARSESVEVGKVLASRPARQRKGRDVTVTLSDGPEPRLVPAVVGRPAEQVKVELEGQGLKLVLKPVDSDTVPSGTALAVDPAAGGRVPRGGTVTLSVSAGPPARPVPTVAGKTYDEAVSALKALALSVTRIDAFDDKVPAGVVIATNPSAGASVRPGLAVAVTVSKGPDVVTVPATTGQDPVAAKQKVTGAGLQVTATFGPPDGKVFSSQPVAGAKVKRGTAVALYTR
jgi:serine/threonine-protein kinase